MADEPRIHHYIPQAYLRGFGWKKGKNWYVNAADLKKLAYFQPNTKNVCAERDFMRFETKDHPPDKLEKEMAKFEGKAREAILRIEQTKTFEGEDKLMVLNLMALLAVRHPQMRENMRDFTERVSKVTMSMALATKERWEGQMRQMKDDGKPVNENVTYEQMKEFHERGEYKVTVLRELQIKSELKVLDTVLRTLVGRKWKLLYAAPDQGEFITSDHPVVITWNNPDKVPPMMRHSPGFGMIDTEVIFPLTHSCCLLGRFEGMEDGVEEAQGMLIAMCNTRMFSHAFDFVFTVDKRFPYMMPPNDPCWDDQFMQRAKDYRDKHPPKEEKVIEWSAEKGPPMPKAMPMPDREERWRAAGFSQAPHRPEEQ